MATIARAGPYLSQELGALSRYSTWVQEPKDFSHLSMLLQVYQQEVELEVDVGAVGGGLCLSDGLFLCNLMCNQKLPSFLRNGQDRAPGYKILAL